MKIGSLRELLVSGQVKCERCLFWVRRGNSSNGECRYYPPRPIVLEKAERRLEITDFDNESEYAPYEIMRAEEEEQWDHALTAWPKTGHGEYCSHWEPNVDCASEIAKLTGAALE